MSAAKRAIDLMHNLAQAVSSSNSGEYEADMPSPSSFEDQAVPLPEVIPLVAERIHYAEGRRTHFTVLAAALFAGGVAVLTFILDKHLAKSIAYVAMTGAIGSIILGLLLLIVYSQQTNRYPWTSATKTWKWFYRDALPDQVAFDSTWRDAFRPNAEKQRLQAAYDDQLPKFQRKMRELSDQKLSLDQDIQQLYVLHINEKFKNLHLTQLRIILSRGLLLLAIAMVASASIGAYKDHQRAAYRKIQEQVGDVTIAAAWHFTSPSDENGLVFATITINNCSSMPYPLPNWEFTNSSGDAVPAIISSSTSSQNRIPSKQKVTYSIFVKPAEPIYVKELVIKPK